MSRSGALPATKATAAAVAGLGVTRRQLDYWVEMGWVRSSDTPARGHPRSFTASEKRVLALLVRLTAAGFPARVAAGPARAAVTRAEEEGGTKVAIGLAPGLVLTVSGV